MNSRRALVTGGSKGIGRAVAELLAAEGWRVTLLARDSQALESTCARLPGDGHQTLTLDVADEDAWKLVASRLEDVQGLVCAAATLDPIGPVGSYTGSSFLRTLEVNVLGTLLAIQTCLPSLRRTHGAVVTFSGGGATAPLTRYDAYAASKAAVVRLTENMAADLRDAGVRINCVAPGFVVTDIHRSTLAAGPTLVGADYFERTLREMDQGGVPAGESAELVSALLQTDSDLSFSGKLISARWDPWRDPGFQRNLFERPDLATLRRIDDMLFTAVPEGSA